MTSTDTSAAEAGVLLYPDSRALPKARSRDTAVNGSKLSLVTADLIVVCLGMMLGTWVNSRINPLDPTSSREYIGLALLSLPLWPMVFTQQLLYRARFLTRRSDEVSRIIRAVGFGMLLTVALSTILKFPIGRYWLGLTSSSVLFLAVVERLVARKLFDRARASGTMMRPVLIAGRNAEGQLVREMLSDDRTLGYQFEGFVEDLLPGAPGESPLSLLGDPGRVVDLADHMGVNSIIIAATAIDVGGSNRLIRALTEHGIHVELSSTLCDIAASRLTVRPVGRVPMMYIEPVKRSGWRPMAKRLFDILVASIVFALTLPLLLTAMLAVRLTSTGPALFSQPRVGRDGDLFNVLKIRTMGVDAEAQLDNIAHLNETSGILFKIKNDPRITPIGSWLRKLSIDELPQLINVIRGEMSLVGPRPALPTEVEQWDPELHNRLRVQPGITGLWQVDGRNGDDHDSTYAQLDLYYVDNWSLVADLVILVRTIPVLIRRKGQH